nr:MAG TPA: choice-of-anchor A domain protein [Caudoviricetes sp.]
MKEIKFRTLLLLALLFIFMLIYAVSSASTKTYDKKYTVSNLLSDYQYVVKDNADIKNHTVGAVLIGGKATLSSFGDAAIENSYIDYVVAYGNYSDGSYFRDTKYKEYYDKYKAYYRDSDYSGELSGLTKINTSYVDFNRAYKEIINESKDLSAGTKITLKKENIDGQDGIALYVPNKHVVVIEKDEWNKCDFIVLDGSLKDFISTKHVISILSDNVQIGTDYSYATVGDNKKAVFVKDDGKLKLLENGNGLMQIKDGSVQGGQLNVDDMKLIWNIPNATEVVTEYLPGHVVAPNANVKINGGNFEGSYIVKSLVSNAEGHFYPYGSVEKQKSTASPTVVVTDTAKPTEVVTATPSPSIIPNTNTPITTPTSTTSLSNITPTSSLTPTPTSSNTPIINPTYTATASPTPINIADDDIPKDNKKIKDGSKKVIDIEEENIPLSDIPDTGDNSNIILALTIFATCGILMVITFFIHKR